MRNQRSILALGGLMVLTWCVVPVLADEVAAPWGTVHGNLSGTAAVDKTANPTWEYILGTAAQFSFELDVKALGWDSVGGGRASLTFDEAGNLYWKTAWPQPRVVSIAPDGTPRWEANTDGVPLGGTLDIIGAPNGDMASVVVGDGGASGRVYAIGWDPNTSEGLAVAYAKSNGQRAWRTVLPGANFAGQNRKLTPVLLNGKLYVVGNPAIGQCQVYKIDSATGAIDWQTAIGTTNVIPNPGGGQMALVENAFGAGVHGLYFNIGDADNLAYGIRLNPATGASDGWVAPTGKTTGGGHSHVTYSSTTGLLYLTTWNDFGKSVDVYDPVAGAKFSGGGTFGHGYYDVMMLDFNGTDVIAGGFDGNIVRYEDPNNGTGQVTEGYYATKAWFGEARALGGLYQDAGGNTVFLSGTNSRVNDFGQDYKARVIAVDITNGTLIDDCNTADDGPLYIDNLVISTNGVSTDPLTVALDVGGFEGYSLGSILSQVNSAQGGSGTRDAVWVEVGNVPGVIDIIADPTGAGKGQVLSIDVPGSCGQGITAVWAQFDKILNQDGLINSNGTIVIEFDQYRTDQGDTIWMSHSADYGQWWSYQPAQGGKITTKLWGPEGVSITTGEWQHITFTFDLENNTITVSNGVETSAPAFLNYKTQDAVFDGFEFEVEDAKAVDNPALKTTPLFEYDTGSHADHTFTVIAGPLLGPIVDGIQRAYYFLYAEPHKLAAIQNDVPPMVLGWASETTHGEPVALVDTPMDQQINIGLGDAIYAAGSEQLTFEPANPPDEPEGFSRIHIYGGSWYYGPYINYEFTGDGPIDVTQTDVKFEFDCRYFQDPTTNTNPYGDAPIFVRMYNYDGATLKGFRDYGIVYATQSGDPPYPTWTHVAFDVVGGTDTNWEGNIFDPTHITRMRFYGTDWAGLAGGYDDFIDVKNVRFIRYPKVGSIALSPTGTGAAATSEPRSLTQTELVIEFSETVNAPAGAVTITGPGGPYNPTLTVDGRFVHAVVSPALADGTYTATVTGITDPSGQGVVGDADVEFVVKVGDADGDHDVDLADFASYQTCLGTFDGVNCVREDFLPSFEIDADDIPPFVTGLEASGPQ